MLPSASKCTEITIASHRIAFFIILLLDFQARSRAGHSEAEPSCSAAQAGTETARENRSGIICRSPPRQGIAPASAPPLTLRLPSRALLLSSCAHITSRREKNYENN